MRKILLTISILATAFLCACGPSAFEIKEMSSACEFNVEIRYAQNDSIGLFVGNTLYLATSQLVAESLYPLSVSTRNPMDIDGRAPTDIIHSDAELFEYVNKRVPGALHFGIVLSDNVGYQIGFDPDAAVGLVRSFFEKSYPGSTAVLFREKSGDLVSAKKLY